MGREQELRGWSSFRTALALVIMGCDAILARTLTPRLVARFGNARVVVGGFLLAVLAYGPLTIAVTEGVDDAEQGLASGLLTTSTQFGSAIGISALTAVYGLASTGSGP